METFAPAYFDYMSSSVYADVSNVFLKAVCRLISLAETDAPGQSLWVLQIDIQEEWKGKEPRKIQVYTNEPSRDGKPLL